MQEHVRISIESRYKDYIFLKHCARAASTMYHHSPLIDWNEALGAAWATVERATNLFDRVPSRDATCTLLR